MKSYKLVNMEFEKLSSKIDALGLGIKQCGISSEHYFMAVKNGHAFTFSSQYDYRDLIAQEITQADFLALPEPFKIGDWIKSNDSRGIIISKIEWVSEDKVQIETFDKNWCIDYVQCTKLTLEQIKVLGLE